MKPQLSIRPLALVVLAGVLLAGCKTVHEQKTEFEDTVLSEEATLAAMRYEVIDFSDEFARTIEFASDQIESQTTDPGIRRRALLWKMHGIPRAFLCLDHPSTVAGLLDLWTLAVQTDAYYRTGDGRDAFGDLQPIAHEATRHLVQSIEGVMRKFCRPDSFELAQGHITDFAAAHPFRADLFSSPSVTRALPERFVPASADVFSSISSLETEVRQLQAKMGLYMEHLPRQARWQAEMLATDLVDQQLLPQLTNVFDQITAERKAILAEVDRQRLDTVSALQEERELIVVAIHEEVEHVDQKVQHVVADTLAEVEAIFDRERTATLAAIDQQRQQTLKAISTDLERVSNDAVDRAYARLWLVLAVVWVGVALLLVLARLLFSSPIGRRRES